MDEKALAADSVFYALFRIVEIDEYAGAEQALDWARMAVESDELREALVERVADRATALRRS